jgi:hypothetical protein
MPKSISKYPKTETAKKLFMDSEHMTWTEFSNSMGWHPHATRVKYPVASWVREKVQVHDAALAIDVQGMMSSRSANWWKETNKTLSEYPVMIDRIKNVVEYRLSKILRMAKADSDGKESKFDAVETSELRQLAIAGKALVEAKMQILMLKDVQVKEFDITPEGEAKIVFELDGGSSPASIRKAMEEWNNK